MDIAFAKQQAIFSAFHWKFSPLPEDQEAASPAYLFRPAYVTHEGLIVWPYEKLQKHPTLFRDFVDLACTLPGVREFTAQHGNPQAEVMGSYLDEFGKLVLVFPSGSQQVTPEEELVEEALAMRRCLRLWEKVQLKDLEGLKRHIRIEADQEKGLLGLMGTLRIVYDSHPELPPGAVPPSPEVRDRVDIGVWDNYQELVQAMRSGNYHPLVYAYIRQVVNERMKSGVHAKLLPERDGDTELVLMAHTLLSALWLQFAEEVAGNVMYYRCKECGKRYRSVGHKDRMFCTPACKMRAHRAKVERAIELKAEGLPVEQIATELGSKVDTIKKWISSKKEK